MRNNLWIGSGISMMGEIPILGNPEKGLAKIMRGLFANSEQGFWYDPNDLATLYQGISATSGTIPVTSTGQPVGLMLDKSKGGGLGTELITNGTFDTGIEGWSSIATKLEYSGSQLKATATSSAMSSTSQSVATTVGKFYAITCDITPSLSNTIKGLGRFKITSGGSNYTEGGLTDGVRNRVQIIVQATTTITVIAIDTAKTGYWGAVGDSIHIDNVSVKELAGNHAYQTVSAMRPLLVATPQRLDYDAVDDKLLTNLPTPLTNATVLRAIPNVGTQVKYNQTLPALYEDSTDHSGLIAINRALTRTEQLKLMTELDKKAGATSFDTTTFKMFDGNQEGFVYDPNDLSTLYQDAAGTIPVTAAGQPVGLVLDKSKGLQLGAELVDTSKFLVANATQILTGTEIELTVTGTVPSTNLEISTTVGALYLFTCEARAAASNTTLNAARIRVNGTNNLHPVSGGRSNKQTLRILHLATTEKTTVQLQVASATAFGQVGEKAYFDAVSVKELKGNHAYQSVSASRPILQQTPILGNELVASGGFSNGTAYPFDNFTASNGGFSAKTTTLKIGGAVSNTVLNVTAGLTYVIAFDLISSLDGRALSVRLVNDKSGAGSGGNSGINTSKLGKNIINYTPSVSGPFYLQFNNGGAAVCDYRVENISVKEIVGYRTDQNYLAFDGVDDFLQTNNIDFTATDKISLFAGVRKLSTVTGMVLELSSSLSANTGSFYLASPAGQESKNQILFANRGTLFTPAQNPNLPPPISVVVSCKGNIAASSTIIRTNGTQFSSAGGLGTGNYGNHPLYIGRRAGTSIPFTGHIYGLIGIGKLTTDTETTAIEKELAKRIGVTLNV